MPPAPIPLFNSSQAFEMLGMARPEMNVVVLAQEAEDPQEPAVQGPRLEHRLVDQFVESVNQKLPAGTVYVDDRDDRVPGQVSGGPKRCGAGQTQNAQESPGLQKTPEVAPFVQLGEVFLADRAAIPLDHFAWIALIHDVCHSNASAGGG